jgi:hypothetical protein
MTGASSPNPPQAILDLAAERQQARAARDFARADALRDEIAQAGWIVMDAPDGFSLTPRPPFDVAASLTDLRAPQLREAACGIALLVDGWPDDLRTCVAGLLDHAPSQALIWLLDLGNVDGAGEVVHELAVEHPDRIVELHCAQTLDQAGWGKATARLIELDPAPRHAVMDLSSVLTGDALGPLLQALDASGVVGAGWRGVDVNLADNWRTFVDASGEVDALLGYLMVVDTEAARATPPHPKARFYRNADMEWSLMLRAAGGRLVAPSPELPVRQDRHRGYHDSDPVMRERESKRTYDRLLAQFRGREEILHPRTSSTTPIYASAPVPGADA